MERLFRKTDPSWGSIVVRRNGVLAQLGIPLALFACVVFVLGAGAVYIAYVRVASAVRVIPQSEVDGLASRINDSVSHSDMISQFVARLASETKDKESIGLMRALVASDPSLLSARYYDENKKLIWELRNPSSVTPDPLDAAQIPSGHLRGSPYLNANGVAVGRVFFPVFDRGGVSRGSVVFLLDLTTYWQYLATYHDGDAYLLDGAGNVIVSRRTAGVDLSAVRARPGAHAFFVGDHTVQSYDTAQGTVLAAWSPIEETGWGVLVEQSAGSVYGQLHAIYAFVAFIAICVLLIFAYEFYLARRRVLRPLRDLVANAKRLAQGEASAWAPIEAGNEFDAVAESINAMAFAMHALQRDFEERIRERTVHLEAKTEEAERLNAFMVNRELRMIELKKENAELRRSQEESKTIRP